MRCHVYNKIGTGNGLREALKEGPEIVPLQCISPASSCSSEVTYFTYIRLEVVNIEKFWTFFLHHRPYNNYCVLGQNVLDFIRRGIIECIPGAPLT